MELLTLDETIIDGFVYPMAMQELKHETAPSSAPLAIRVRQKAGEHYVTVCAFRDDGTAPAQPPVTVTISSGRAAFGRQRKPLLSFAVHDVSPSQLADLFTLTAQALLKFHGTEQQLNNSAKA